MKLGLSTASAIALLPCATPAEVGPSFRGAARYATSDGEVPSVRGVAKYAAEAAALGEGMPGSEKKQVLVVVDMENAYCSAEVCGGWYDPARDDGPGYDWTPKGWQGGVDSVPPERSVISRIADVIGATADGKSYWDYIIFTHDWNDYGLVCMTGGEDVYNLSKHECWEMSAQHGSTSCGDHDSGCQSSLVAWTKGTEIVKPLQDAVNKAYVDSPKRDAGMQSDNVIHMVKKHANWGFAKHQSMSNRTQPQGKFTPLHLSEKLGLLPHEVRLTITGSFTQYCVLAGTLQMMLAGFGDMVIAEPSTGGYADSAVLKDPCPHDEPAGGGCYLDLPYNGTPAEVATWMARTAGSNREGDFSPGPYASDNKQAPKHVVLGWMDLLGLTVHGTWEEYTSWMSDQGAKVPDCYLEGWCA